MSAPTQVAEVTSRQLAHKHLLNDVLWGRLTRRIVREKNMELSRAERIMDQTLAFLALCAEETRGEFSPSEQVDIGWHTFILYTQEYQEFCKSKGSKYNIEQWG